MADEDFVLVAAIDFGTTFSGYAFSFRSNPEDIKMNRNWGAAQGIQSLKAPTSVLINSSGEFAAFGYEAEDTYGKYLQEETEGDEGSGWQLYRHFKMMLHNSKEVTRNSMIESCSGEKRSALDIFAYSLRYLKNHLIEVLAAQTTSAPRGDQIRWVATVPAIWTDQAKQFMREAAFKAGLIRQRDSHQLLIALEPECASLYCRRLKSAEFVNEPEKDTLNFPAGTRYLIIDSGGGTVDVTAHQILEGNKVRELLCASGGDWAGKQVDNCFLQLLEEALGADFIAFYRRACPQQWLVLMTEFESIKRRIKPDGECTLCLGLPWSINDKYSQFSNGSSLQQKLNSKQSLGVSFSNGSLVVQHVAIRKLFVPTINKIIDHVESLMGSPKLHPLKYFFLVGGFSECRYFQSMLLDRFAGRVHVLIPSESQMAVIKGAVLFGHNPQEIKSRVARKTYGCRFLQTFDEKLHNPSKKILAEGVATCTDLFKVFVAKDEEVQIGDIRTFEFTALESEQSGADFHLLCLDRRPKSVQYADEDGVQKLGEVHVDMPVKTGGTTRVVVLSVTFGGTEISIEAMDKTSGEKGISKLDFLAK